MLDDDEDGPKQKKKREKKKKEKEVYKSAQFIEDSDEDYGNMEEFLEKERQLRERGPESLPGGNPWLQTALFRSNDDEKGKRQRRLRETRLRSEVDAFSFGRSQFRNRVIAGALSRGPF